MKKNTLVLIAVAAMAYWYWKKHRFDDYSGRDPH